MSAYVAEPGPSAGYYANLTGSHWGLSERPLLLILQPQEAGDGSIRPNVSILTPAFEKSRAKLLPIPIKSGVTYTAWPEDADPFVTALGLLPNLDDTVIYVDGNVRTFITDGLQQAAPNARVVNAPVEVRRLRERKSSEELDIMKCVNEVSWNLIERSRRLTDFMIGNCPFHQSRTQVHENRYEGVRSQAAGCQCPYRSRFEGRLCSNSLWR